MSKGGSPEGFTSFGVSPEEGQRPQGRHGRWASALLAGHRPAPGAGRRSESQAPGPQEGVTRGGHVRASPIVGVDCGCLSKC